MLNRRQFLVGTGATAVTVLLPTPEKLKVASASVVSFDSDGFTLSWTKVRGEVPGTFTLLHFKEKPRHV